MVSKHCCSGQERQERKADLGMTPTAAPAPAAAAAAAAAAADADGVLHESAFAPDLVVSAAGAEDCTGLVVASLASAQTVLQTAGTGKQVDATLAGQTCAHACASVDCHAEASLQLTGLHPHDLIHHSAGLTPR